MTENVQYKFGWFGGTSPNIQQRLAALLCMSNLLWARGYCGGGVLSTDQRLDVEGPTAGTNGGTHTHTHARTKKESEINCECGENI